MLGYEPQSAWILTYYRAHEETEIRSYGRGTTILRIEITLSWCDLVESDLLNNSFPPEIGYFHGKNKF